MGATWGLRAFCVQIGDGKCWVAKFGVGEILQKCKLFNAPGVSSLSPIKPDMWV
jgi:hypothetical protein